MTTYNLPPRLDTIAKIVSTSTGHADLDYKARFDAEVDGLGRIALVAPLHDYVPITQWNIKIPLWNPMRIGDHHIVATQRRVHDEPTMITAINEEYRGKTGNILPVYDLERIALTHPFPDSINENGTVRCFGGKDTDVAKAYHAGKHLYGIELDNGLNIMVAGEGVLGIESQGKRVHVIAHPTGKVDLISRPIYEADVLEEVKRVA